MFGYKQLTFTLYSEILHEDEKFKHRELAALLASKVFTCVLQHVNELIGVLSFGTIWQCHDICTSSWQTIQSK
jgi:hypothetical protein